MKEEKRRKRALKSFGRASLPLRIEEADNGHFLILDRKDRIRASATDEDEAKQIRQNLVNRIKRIGR